MSSQVDVVIRNKNRVFDGFFQLDEVTLSHRLFDGGMSAEKKILIFERGDAVAALIYNKTDHRVVLVEQFKAPTLEKGSGNGWITEVMAGMIKPGETPEQALARETLEETGYRITDWELITTFFSSPGGSSERIFLYHVVVEAADKVAQGGGNTREGEDIRVVTMSPDVLFEKLSKAQLEDPKLIIAAYHLKERLRLTPRKAVELPSGRGRMYQLKDAPGLRLGIQTGRVLDARDIEVWVSPENTDMMMDRVIGRTISANIRYGGAEKDARGNIVEDTIADALRVALGTRRHVQPGEVIETTAGALAENGARTILHVAVAVGQGPASGVSADPATVATCVTNVLEHVQRGNSGFRIFGRKYRSLLLPLMGTGDGGLTLEQVAPLLVGCIKRFYRSYPDTALSEIYLLAFTNVQRSAIEDALLVDGEFTPVPDGAIV
jgi:nudix-type nucleoside diphosphatase (YffH/AdpP family)